MCVPVCAREHQQHDVTANGAALHSGMWRLLFEEEAAFSVTFAFKYYFVALPLPWTKRLKHTRMKIRLFKNTGWQLTCSVVCVSFNFPLWGKQTSSSSLPFCVSQEAQEEMKQTTGQPALSTRYKYHLYSQECPARKERFNYENHLVWGLTGL